MKIQPRIKGVVRERGASKLHPALRRKIKADAKAFGTSQSWVEATAIAAFYNFKEQPRYFELAKAYIRRVK